MIPLLANELAFLGAGITFIVTFGSLFEPLRQTNAFFKCSLCLGFWVGVCLALLSLWRAYGMRAVFSLDVIGQLFRMGVETSLLSFFVYCLLTALYKLG